MGMERYKDCKSSLPHPKNLHVVGSFLFMSWRVSHIYSWGFFLRNDAIQSRVPIPSTFPSTFQQERIGWVARYSGQFRLMCYSILLKYDSWMNVSIDYLWYSIPSAVIFKTLTMREVLLLILITKSSSLMLRSSLYRGNREAKEKSTQDLIRIGAHGFGAHSIFVQICCVILYSTTSNYTMP